MNSRFVSLLVLGSAFGLFAACSSGSTTGRSVAAPNDGGGGEAESQEDASTSEEEDAPTTSTSCSSAREQLLLPIGKTSTGDVSVVSDTNGVKTIYVDASAGGQAAASKNPRIYVDLAAGTKVNVTDVTSTSSTAWDLAFKRSVIFTNSGDAGPGKGGAVQVNKPFASFTNEDATATKVEKESFFDEECNPKLDPIGAPQTTFSDWYGYDEATNVPTPRNVSFVVVGGTGKKYKVGIKAYDALPDGGSRMNTATGFYLLQVTAL